MVYLKKLLSQLAVADPETAEAVAAGFRQKEYTPSPEIAEILVRDVIWGLSLEISCGRAIALGYVNLAVENYQNRLNRYSSLVRRAGAKGATLGKIMAESLVPVLKHDDRFVDKFLRTVTVMESKGVYLLNSPLNALSIILNSRDFESASALLSLYSSIFSYELSYNRCKYLAFTISRGILSFSKEKRVWQIEQLHRVIKVSPDLVDLFFEGMDKGLHLLSQKALFHFVLSALTKFEQNSKLGAKFLALESKLGIDTYENMCVTALLVQIQDRLNRYLGARIINPLFVRSISELPELHLKNIDGIPMVCSDGKYVYLPDEIDIFDSKEKNFALYRFLVGLEAGYYEFNTFDFDLDKIGEYPESLYVLNPEIHNGVFDFELFFSSFPLPELAADLFLIFEHGRLKVLLSNHYPGLYKQTLTILQQAGRKILKNGDGTDVVFLLYAWIALDLSPDQLSLEYKIPTKRLSLIPELFENKIKKYQNVEICAELVIETYGLVEKIVRETGGKKNSKPDYVPINVPFGRRLRPELFFISHGEKEKIANRIKLIIEKKGYKVYKSEIRKHLIDNKGHLSLDKIEKIIISYAENHQGDKRTDQTRITGLSEFDFAGLLTGEDPCTVTADYGAEHVYRYKEWDYTLNDYIHNHVRVLHREIPEIDGNFYADTIRQNSGLVKRIRYSFELLKPSGISILRRWVEGDEFDYRELLDFAIDKKSGILPSDRIYIKRVKENRDVAVLLLMDLSRSTANKVAGSNKTVLDVEKEAMVLFCEALSVVGDRFSIAGFSGTGRLGVDYFSVKEFDDKMGTAVKQKINALTPKRSTRMGAAIRHATSRLEKVSSKVRLLFIIGDGFPNDTGYKRDYAIKDTRRAISEACARNIHAKALTINIQGDPRLDDLFGAANHNVISDVQQLPDRLLQIYKLLTK